MCVAEPASVQLAAMDGASPSVMIEKLAIIRGKVPSEFLDLNHTRKHAILVSLIPKFAP